MTQAKKKRRVYKKDFKPIAEGDLTEEALTDIKDANGDPLVKDADGDPLVSVTTVDDLWDKIKEADSATFPAGTDEVDITTKASFVNDGETEVFKFSDKGFTLKIEAVDATSGVRDTLKFGKANDWTHAKSLGIGRSTTIKIEVGTFTAKNIKMTELKWEKNNVDYGFVSYYFNTCWISTILNLFVSFSTSIYPQYATTTRWIVLALMSIQIVSAWCTYYAIMLLDDNPPSGIMSDSSMVFVPYVPAILAFILWVTAHIKIFSINSDENVVTSGTKVVTDNFAFVKNRMSG
tara:strand:+ start:12727 stop:13599 length:873 start_codon:yes stop_codon:yes gene_type:complete